MSAFYRKRIGRIALPLVFWSLALPALYCVYLNCGGTTSNPQVVMEDHTLRATLTKLYTFVFNFNYDTTPLWYLYMLVGLYLIMPILSVWLQQASRRDLKLALWLWGATLVLPYIGMAAPMLGYAGNYGNPGILGVCDWNPYGTFYYVSGFAGYLVLAYYLVKYPPAWSWRRTLALGIPMFAAGYAVTAFGYLAMQSRFPGNYAYLEIVWYFTGINVFLMTFPVFLVVRKLRLKPRRWLARLASLTFGIYLCHFIFVQIGYDLIGTIGSLPVLACIVLTACCAFAVSAALVWLMSRWKWTWKLVR